MLRFSVFLSRKDNSEFTVWHKSSSFGWRFFVCSIFVVSSKLGQSGGETALNLCFKTLATSAPALPLARDIDAECQMHPILAAAIVVSKRNTAHPLQAVHRLLQFASCTRQ